MTMTPYICRTCGTQHTPSERPPARCRICEDERQYVGWEGQAWTTVEDLALHHRVVEEEDTGMLSLGMRPGFAIDQRSLLLETDAGNLLWEALPLVTDEAVAAVRARGGAERIVICHPHFHASMVAGREVRGGIQILLHEATRPWVQRPDPRIEFWAGDQLSLSTAVTLIRTGGHFEGSTALHWSDGPRPGGALFSGDVPQVVMDRRSVSFMYSYPNLIPMRTRHVLALRERLSRFDYQDVFGYAKGREIRGEARAAVDASFDRYLAMVRDGGQDVGAA